MPEESNETKPVAPAADDSAEPVSDAAATDSAEVVLGDAPAEKEAEVEVSLNLAGFEANAANGYVWGTGRRKSSVARVRIRPGKGLFEINKRAADEFFCNERDRESIRSPLKETNTLTDVDVFVRVQGGGTTGQAGAILLGVARALKKLDPACEPILRQRNLLTRDARKVERKKYGQRGARRRFQFSKR